MPLFDEDTNMLLLVGKVSHPVIPSKRACPGNVTINGFMRKRCRQAETDTTQLK